MLYVAFYVCVGTGFVWLTAQFGSAPGGIYAIGKAHMRSTSSLRSFPNVAFEKGSSVRLTDDWPLSSFKEDRLALPVKEKPTVEMCICL